MLVGRAGVGDGEGVGGRLGVKHFVAGTTILYMAQQ